MSKRVSHRKSVYIIFSLCVLVTFSMRRVRNVLSQTYNTHTAEDDASLYIYVHSYTEGMASWTKAICELLVIAKKLNAVYVEPCLLGGRLAACDVNHGRLRLFDVFDIDQARAYHPRIIRFDEFKGDNRIRRLLSMKDTTPRRRRRLRELCMYGIPPGKHGQICPGVAFGYNKDQIPLIDQLITAGSSKYPSVLNIIHMTRRAFAAFMPGALEEAMKVRKQHLRFRLEHYQQVDVLLRRMNMTAPVAVDDAGNGTVASGSFTLIHWRGEITTINYTECAQYIHSIPEVQQERLHNQPILLMSTLNLQKDRMWPGAASMAGPSAEGALRWLLDHDFRKVDTVLTPQDVIDPGILAVWDLILATKAETFSTCSRQCSAESLCKKCNFAGNMAAYATELREIEGKKTIACWGDQQQ